MIKILLFFACIANASMFSSKVVDHVLFEYPDSNWTDTNFYIKTTNPGEEDQIRRYYTKNDEFYDGVLYYKDNKEEYYDFIEQGVEVKDSVSFDYTDYWRVSYYNKKNVIVYYFPDQSYKVVWTYNVKTDHQVMKFYEQNKLCKTYEVNPNEFHFYRKTICPDGKKSSNSEYNCKCKKKDWPMEDFIM
jgi:hypothetical protein